MAQNVRPKTSFTLGRQLQPLHSGGAASLSGDGSWLVTTLGDTVAVTDVETGNRISTLEGDSSDVTSLVLTPTPSDPRLGGFLLVCQQSHALRIYSLPDLELHKNIPRAHDAPIITCAVDPTGTLFATGAADGIIKVWDARRGHCTHVFKGHGGVISALLFDIVTGTSRARLVSGADDTKIRVWDLRTSSCLSVLEGHVSVIRGLDFTPDHKFLVSGSRDKVVNVWDMKDFSLSKTVPVFESLEAAGVVSFDDSLYFYTAGESGQIRLWDFYTNKRVAETPAHAKNHALSLVLHTGDTLTSIDVDENIVTYRLPDLEQTRQIVGFNDEIIDLALVDGRLAAATNSHLIKLYDLDRVNTHLLEGHSDTVLCLASSADGSLLASGSKDKTAKIWNADGDSLVPFAVAKGHAEALGAISFSRKSNNFLATASQDHTVKIWALSRKSTSDDSLTSLVTVKAHDKDINALDVAPNDKFLVTGSQDRTAKLYRIDYTLSASDPSGASCSLTHVGTFNGHKRGVWSVKFSPTDRLLATSSGDRTVKLWSLTDFSCTKSFEGHSNSVLRVLFISGGHQLASSASDGLVKVWNIKDESCVATLDNHEDKVWALTASEDGAQIISGGADSTVSFWDDVTEEQELEKIAFLEDQVVKDQEFDNYVAIKDYSNAIWLALQMNQPKRLLRLFTLIQSEKSSQDVSSITGSVQVDEIITSLDHNNLRQLVEYVSLWNTNSRTSHIAQIVLHAILKFFPADELLQLFEETQSTEEEVPEDAPKPKTTQKTITQLLQGLIPYTERHLARTDRILRESFIVEHLLTQMDAIVDVATEEDGMAPMEIDSL